MSDIKTLEQENFPSIIKFSKLSQKPERLYLLGDFPSEKYKYLTIVGSRKHSTYGAKAVKMLVQGLAHYPIVIVSGLAVGLDSLAHEAAISAGLTTLAIPGSGLADSVLYPPSRRGLARRILGNGGALLSPFPPEHPSTKWTFPVRNELMAAMSHATLVVEAARKSGTLITAHLALNMGRDVMVVPGNIFESLSYGPHMLMRRGATPVTSSYDILEGLGFAVTRRDGMEMALPNYAEIPLSPEQRVIMDLIVIQGLDFTSLCEKTGYSAPVLSENLTELELLGLIEKSEGSFFPKVS